MPLESLPQPTSCEPPSNPNNSLSAYTFQGICEHRWPQFYLNPESKTPISSPSYICHLGIIALAEIHIRVHDDLEEFGLLYSGIRELLQASADVAVELRNLLVKGVILHECDQGCSFYQCLFVFLYFYWNGCTFEGVEQSSQFLLQLILHICFVYCFIIFSRCLKHIKAIYSYMKIFLMIFISDRVPLKNLLGFYDSLHNIKSFEYEMGNSQIPDMQYSQGFGDYVQEKDGLISKYYVMSSSEEVTSFSRLLNSYCNPIQTIVPIVHSQLLELQSGQKAWKLQFLVPPKTLSQKIDEHRTNKQYFMERQIIAVIDCILSALITLCTKMLMHGNIAPNNIYVKQKEGQNIYSIGIPLLFNQKMIEKTPDDKTSYLLYTSPEYLRQIYHQKTRPAVYQKNDVFSLGIIALEMASLEKVDKFYALDRFEVESSYIDKLTYMCRERYSLPFCKLMSNMLAPNLCLRPEFTAVQNIFEGILLNGQDCSRNSSQQRLKISELNRSQADNLKAYLPEVQAPNFTEMLFVSTTNRQAWEQFIHEDAHCLQ